MSAKDYSLLKNKGRYFKCLGWKGIVVDMNSINDKEPYHSSLFEDDKW